MVRIDFQNREAKYLTQIEGLEKRNRQFDSSYRVLEQENKKFASDVSLTKAQRNKFRERVDEIQKGRETLERQREAIALEKKDLITGNPLDITGLGTPIAFITSPTGGGNRNIEVIRDGIIPPVGNSNPAAQYDTYNGSTTRLFDWIGYVYPTARAFGRLIFQEGIHATNGGFFSGNPKVEIRIGGQWIETTGLHITPTYDAIAAPNYSVYTLQFNSTVGDGIRIAGIPGGSARFISVGELRVIGGAVNDATAEAQKPKNFDLLTNYPNPFNPSTTIEFRVPATSHVSLSVFSVNGQKVRTLVDKVMGEGSWPITWDGRDDNGKQLSSGVYLYKLQAGDFISTRKMVFSK